ncbi:glycine N-acyltransferase-like protein 3 [Echeneis naucrates]|uniref:glycine N-acyltransferase-like protein 3 n=1 Tax=Echeneis naucrates TaxID=173247 RepID=UPI0011137A96|nr:glycine N-acyltransferase-like protein 3 [Echeneis naucrates]
MELTGDQLEKAEEELRRYFPKSQLVYGTLVLNKRVRADPVKFIVDKWPEFRVFICKPQCLQEDDLFRDTLIFTTDPAALKEIVENSSVIDWTKYMRLGIDLCHVDVLKGMASEKNVSSNKITVCNVMTLQDMSRLPPIDSISSGISLGSLDESYVDLVAQTWKFGKGGAAKNMIRNMIVNFPSCCVLDADRKPVSWILTFSDCSMGMLNTLQEHRQKGYAKVVTITLARRLHAEGYPVYCLVEQQHESNIRLLKEVGFTEDPSYRLIWFELNDL